ncbi:MAG: hypothetical protein R3284_06090 [Rubricoccaceae bacterium]|nr:hypothetical protein [Rubricoccaceae bacterium]
MKVLLIRSGVYFSVVFGVAVILGTMRVLWLVPQVGERTAELIESPLMLTVIYFSARFVTQRIKASRGVEYLYSGLLALVFVLAVEFSVVLGVEGISLREYFAERDAVAGVVYAVMLIIFAVMPWLVGKRHVAT